MAKELAIKIKVDGQEIDLASKSINQVNEQIDGLKNKLAEVPIGSAEFKKINGDIQSLEAGFRKAKDATQPFMESFSQLPGVLGYVGRSIKGVGEAFTLLEENPIIAVLTALGYVVIKVSEKLGEMQSVMEPLEAVGETLQEVFSSIVNLALKPTVAVIDTLMKGYEGILNIYGRLTGKGNDYGTTLIEQKKKQQELNNSQSEYEKNLAAVQAQIQKAREASRDQNLPLEERRKALEKANQLEKQVSDEGKKRQLQDAQTKTAAIAAELGAGADRIKAISSMSTKELEIYIANLKATGNYNKQKVDAIIGSIKAIEEVDRTESTRNIQYQRDLKRINNEGNKDSNEAAKAQQEFKKKLFEIEQATRLADVKDEQEKQKISLANEKAKAIEEIDTMTISKKQKQKLKDALDAEYLLKEHQLQIKLSEEIDKAERDRVKKEEDFNKKVRGIEIAAIEDDVTKSKAAREEKFNDDVDALYKDFNFLMENAENQAKILANLKKAKENDIKKIDDKAAQDKLNTQVKEYQDEIALLTAQQKGLDKNSKAYWDNATKIEDLAFKAKLAKVKKGSKEEETIVLEHQQNLKNIEQSSFESRMKLGELFFQKLGGLAKGIQQLAEDDKETQKFAIRVQEAATIGQLVMADITAIRKAYKDSPTTFGLPWSAFYVADIAIGTLAANQAANKAIAALDKQAPSSSGAAASGMGANYGSGGLLEGPRHAAGGMMINAEGGEAVMTRGAVTAFGPLLSQLNQLGGGTSFGSMSSLGQAKHDAPKTTQNTDGSYIKTYVVESELTSMQQRQARLKDLSTL